MLYVISDIHSHYEALMKIFEKLNFDSNKDVLILNGDMFDRGQYPIEMYNFCRNTAGVKCLLGNHELLQIEMIAKLFGMKRRLISYDAVEDCTNNGGLETFQAFERKQIDILDFYDWMCSLPVYKAVYLNGEKFIITHAGIPFGVCKWQDYIEGYKLDVESVLKRVTETDLGVYYTVWDRSLYQGCCAAIQYHFDSTIVIGHTPTQESNFMVDAREKLLCIDCGMGYNKHLACVCLDTMKVMYSDKLEWQSISK